MVYILLCYYKINGKNKTYFLQYILVIKIYVLKNQTHKITLTNKPFNCINKVKRLFSYLIKTY